MVVDRLAPRQQFTPEQLKAEVAKWEEEQKNANEPEPGSTLPLIKTTEHPVQFCPPTFVAMSAKALEDKEDKEKEKEA